MTTPTVTIDVLHDGSTYVGAAKLTSPSKYWPRAAADALSRLRVPKDGVAIIFRRQGKVIRHVALEFLLRGDA
jgi:hypothetical protein